MAVVPAGMSTELGAGHRRHRPEGTLLYQIIEQHYPDFAAMMSAQGRPLPIFVQREFGWSTAVSLRPRAWPSRRTSSPRLVTPAHVHRPAR